MVMEGDDQKYAMTTGCCYSSNNRFNLYSGHAYTLLGGSELRDGTRLVAIRNPHGKEIYKGAWSDDDAKWTASVKSQVRTYRNVNDGTFHMELNDYLDTFNDLSILYYRDDWKMSRFRYNGPEVGRQEFKLNNQAT